MRVIVPDSILGIVPHGGKADSLARSSSRTIARDTSARPACFNLPRAVAARESRLANLPSPVADLHCLQPWGRPHP